MQDLHFVTNGAQRGAAAGYTPGSLQIGLYDPSYFEDEFQLVGGVCIMPEVFIRFPNCATVLR